MMHNTWATAWLMMAIPAIASVLPATPASLAPRSAGWSNTTTAAGPMMILTPLRAVHQRHTRRDRKSVLELKPLETLRWIGSDGTLAQFTVRMPGDEENILNLELVEDLVEKVDCPTTGDGNGDLKIRFAEVADLNNAADLWGWVNKKQANHFLLIVGAGMCGGGGGGGGGTKDRVVYDVSGLTYDNSIETAVLQVRKTTWKQAAHTFELTLGKVEQQRALAARDTTSFSIPFDNSFGSQRFSISADRLTVSATCLECYTTGSFDVAARFRVENLSFQEAWFELSTQGISARAKIGLGLIGTLVSGHVAEKSVTVFKFSPYGISIPGVLTIGPTVSVSMGVSVSQLTAGVNIVLGATALMARSSSHLDFLSSQRSSSTGWKPRFSSDPARVDGYVEARAVAYVRPAIGLEISVVETGLAAEIIANTPQLSASLKAISSPTCTACGDYQAAVQGSVAIGASIGATLKSKIVGIETTLFGVTFAETETPIAGFCQGFGLRGSACLAG